MDVKAETVPFHAGSGPLASTAGAIGGAIGPRSVGNAPGGVPMAPNQRLGAGGAPPLGPMPGVDFGQPMTEMGMGMSASQTIGQQFVGRPVLPVADVEAQAGRWSSTPDIKPAAADELSDEPPSSSPSSETEVSGSSSSSAAPLPASVGGLMHWSEAAAKMLEQRVLAEPSYPSRPLRLDPVRYAIFMEQPKVSRREPGSDSWVCSGGRKGATDYWADDGSHGIRKRYGKVRQTGRVEQSLGQTGARYLEYCLLDGSRDNPSEDKSICLFEVFPASWSKLVRAQRGTKPRGSARGAAAPGLQAWQRARQQATVASGQAAFVLEGHEEQKPATAVVDVRMAAPTEPRGEAKAKFMSFQVSGSQLELGAIVRQGAGVTLESAQGDFAEWHRRSDGEQPFQEGDVIGFDRRGLISRRTAGATMLGVISRKAVVEGSAPPAHERGGYDTVAYCGVVPVRVQRTHAGGSTACECDFSFSTSGPAVGDVLVPSGNNDGVAVRESL
jgi:hypothetical protein